MYFRSRVRIPAPYARWTFFHINFPKKYHVCLQKTGNKPKEAEDGPLGDLFKLDNFDNIFSENGLVYPKKILPRHKLTAPTLPNATTVLFCCCHKQLQKFDQKHYLSYTMGAYLTDVDTTYLTF